jgi:hypothetical protein
MGKSAVLTLMTILACTACGEPAALTGTLEVSTQTRGEPRDEDGYELWVDDQLEATLGLDDATTLELSEGLHLVRLAGIAPTCAVDGDNPATTSVFGAAPRALAFRVECGPGTLSVSATFAGEGAPPSALVVLVDGSPSGSVAAGTPLVLSLEPGVHEVGLADIPERCTLTGSNPRTATVTRNATTSLAFSLTCSSSEASQP